MKNHLSIALILFISLMHTISYASDDSNSQEEVFRAREVDTLPRVLKAVQPIYPSMMSFEGELFFEGRVKVRLIVTKDGRARDPEVVSAEPEGVFEASALEAIRKFKYKPAVKDGEPVECYVIQPMIFSIPGVEGSFDAYEVTKKGLKYIKVGEYDKAIEAFTEAIKISKRYSPGYSGRGMAYMYLKEYEKAIKDFDLAIKRSPKLALNYKLRGEANSAMKDYNKAIKDFDHAIKIEPEMLGAYFARGEAFRNMEKYSEAISDYAKVIELDKSFLQAYNNRAFAYNKLKDSENMCADLKKACDLGDCRGLELAKNAGKCSAYTGEK